MHDVVRPSKTAAIMELTSGYSAYTEAGELRISAVSDAPELWFTISVVIGGARVSSVRCGIWASAASGAVSGWILNR